MKFEEAIKRLEAIVAELERGEPELEKAMALFREGAELIKNTTALLDNAEQEVKILLRSDSGELAEAPFEA